jgi:hypothetical protein
MNEIIEYVGVIARQVDSTLLDEWEKLKRRGSTDQSKIASIDAPVPEEYDITRHKRAFSVAIRNEAFQYVKALSHERFQFIVDMCKATHPEHPWSLDLLRERLGQYRLDHVGPVTDRRSRSGELFKLIDSPNEIMCEQLLCDEDGHNDWLLVFAVDISASRAAGRPVMSLRDFRSIENS